MAFDNFWGLGAGHPSRAAMVEPDEHAVTGGELLASANQLVHGLRALGLERDDVIAAVLPNSVQAYELLLAVQQAGSTSTPPRWRTC